MRSLLIVLALILSNQLFAQTQDELNIKKLSAIIFRFEVENKIDSLENIIHEKFISVGSNGSIQTKNQFLDRLKGGNFIHNKIEIEDNKSIIFENTATLVGKGKFTVTISGQTDTKHLSYMLIFIKTQSNNTWKLFALKASIID